MLGELGKERRTTNFYNFFSIQEISQRRFDDAKKEQLDEVEITVLRLNFINGWRFE